MAIGRSNLRGAWRGLALCLYLASRAPAAPAPGSYAIVSTVVSRPCDVALERDCRAHHTELRIAALAWKLGCQLASVGYAGPKVLIMHGNYSPGSTGMLSAQGWRLYNVTQDLHALYTTVHGRPAPPLQLPPKKSSTVQPRNDGWATLYKLYAWSLADFELVLHTDLDVVFTASPDAFMAAAFRSGLVFQALPEKAHRGYYGLNTHMMLLRPNRDVFATLMTNALRGHFVPFTRTEQDVLETMFPPEVSYRWNVTGGAVPWPRHKHWGPDAEKAICRRHTNCCPAPNERGR
ncbi:hypothetical protein T492DRAFT_1033061 [Pavlovales sp. CCMP2436]|nr:hypothetical protein T492DRAFT_1033061 [Pavlovales sp. CCMP2436]|mmetsp:Transcript_37889/g.89015  ORF Transcript_37889/g.89015 Transcript_37889/m.89015 type:complete len:291 (+) Transcript_37889:1741-2613(+)